MQSSRALSARRTCNGLGLIGAHLLLGRTVYVPTDLVAPDPHRAATDRALDQLDVAPGDRAPARLRAALAQALAYRPQDRPTLPELLDALRAASPTAHPA